MVFRCASYGLSLSSRLMTCQQGLKVTHDELAVSRVHGMMEVP
jgi:hypothetical protein